MLGSNLNTGLIFALQKSYLYPTSVFTQTIFLKLNTSPHEGFSGWLVLHVGGLCVCSAVKFGSVIPPCQNIHACSCWVTCALQLEKPGDLQTNTHHPAFPSFRRVWLLHCTCRSHSCNCFFFFTHSFSDSPCARHVSPLFISSALFLEWEFKQ